MPNFLIIKITLLILISSIFYNAKAQRSEIGILLGTSFYLGDLNPSTPFGMSQPAGGVIYRYNFNYRWSLKTNVLFGILKADDKITNKPQADRNLSFRSYILEFSPQVEFNFFKYQTGHHKYKFSPYLFSGLCLFYFNPQTQYNGKWYSLQPLGTEGQGTTAYPERKTYSLISVGIPFGLGIKYSPSKIINFGLEWGLRKTFTDYIDDVSTVYADANVLLLQKSYIAAELSDRSSPKHTPGVQRGDSSHNDWYSFLGFTMTFRLDFSDKNCAAYPKRILYPKLFKSKKKLPNNNLPR